jgi:hypothetical protein
MALNPSDLRTEDFPTALEDSVMELRGAFGGLLESVDGLPERPLQLARRLRLDKNLAWKVVRLVQSTESTEAVRHLPGPAGVKRVLDAFAQGGAGDGEVSAVRDAVSRFDRMVGRHAGDRATLELLLASGAPEGVDPLRLEASRKLAFQGNSATLGVQARVRLGMQVLAPSPEKPELVDILAIAGLVDFRRLRASAAWPLLSVHTYGGNEVARQPLVEPPEPELGPSFPLLGEFSTKPLPPIRALAEPDGIVYELAEGPVGDTAASTCLFGWRSPGFASVRGGPTEVAEFMLRTETPAEVLVFDLLVHRDLPFDGAPRAQAFSFMHGLPRYPLVQNGRYELPLSESVEELGFAHEAHASPAWPRHRELLSFALAATRMRPEEFRCHRLTLRYPPIPAVMTFSYPLLPLP